MRMREERRQKREKTQALAERQRVRRRGTDQLIAGRGDLVERREFGVLDIHRGVKRRRFIFHGRRNRLDGLGLEQGVALELETWWVRCRKSTDELRAATIK
jgi:hypothetical protein